MGPSSPSRSTPSFSVRRARSILRDRGRGRRGRGRQCSVAAEGINQESVHPNSDLLVRSGGGEVALLDVERAPNVRTEATGTLTLGTDVSVFVRLGPDGLFLGGLVLTIDCPTLGAEGCTPGFWKNHLEAWAPTGFAPDQTLGSVFDAAGLGWLPRHAQHSPLLRRRLGARGGQADSAPPSGRRSAQRCAPRRRLHAHHGRCHRRGQRRARKRESVHDPRHQGRADGCQRSRLRPELSAEFDGNRGPYVSPKWGASTMNRMGKQPVPVRILRWLRLHPAGDLSHRSTRRRIPLTVGGWCHERVRPSGCDGRRGPTNCSASAATIRCIASFKVRVPAAWGCRCTVRPRRRTRCRS